MLPEKIQTSLHEGKVIPAMPLALDRNRRFDIKHQRAIIRYYLDAEAGGIAAGVHTTQFAIRQAGLYEPVLELAAEECRNFTQKTGNPVIKIAGVIGSTPDAVKEAEIAVRHGYDIALLSLAAFSRSSNRQMLDHCRIIAEIIPLMGFYLQPAVGGRKLDTEFWREFSKIENVAAIKVAPFNRYQTYDVVRGVAESGRASEIALYTGNDDNILADLLTVFEAVHEGKIIEKKFAGGLLGHWAVWTRSAVMLLNDVKTGKYDGNTDKALKMAARITDCNSAFFDAANNFKGCIAGLHEVLRRQALMAGTWTLDRKERLSPSQKSEIDRVYKAYPELNDDEFVRENLDRWLR